MCKCPNLMCTDRQLVINYEFSISYISLDRNYILYRTFLK